MFAIAHAAENGAGGGLSIHLAPEVIGYLGSLPITNTILTAWLVVALILVCVFLFRTRYALVPTRGQIIVESVVGGAFEYVAQTLESRAHARVFFPLIMTIFIFILALNWVGLLPGVGSVGFFQEHDGYAKLVPMFYPANTDLNITLAFALVAFVTIEVAGVALLGILKYGGKFVTFKSPLAFVIGLIELIGEIARLISFSFRLFGNIFAGKTLLAVAIFFAPFVVPIPILAFEVFVGFIQALVFAVLTLFFIKLAITEHSEEH